MLVFAVSGALVVSRERMDLVGFALLGVVTGIGGGTLRDVLLGALPVFWVRESAYLVACVAVSTAVFFTAHIPRSRHRLSLWFDSLGLSPFAITGAERTLLAGSGPVIAVGMGAITATFGGARDVLGADSPVVLGREVYVTAALLGGGLCRRVALLAAGGRDRGGSGGRVRPVGSGPVSGVVAAALHGHGHGATWAWRGRTGAMKLRSGRAANPCPAHGHRLRMNALRRSSS